VGAGTGDQESPVLSQSPQGKQCVLLSRVNSALNYTFSEKNFGIRPVENPQHKTDYCV